jgi:hypothetical protein
MPPERESSHDWTVIILKRLNFVTRAGMKITRGWNRCFWKIEQAGFLLTNPNSRLQSTRNQRRWRYFYFRAHGRNAKAWWNPKESWERYDYLYSRTEIKKHAERITTAASSPRVKKAFAFYNNHARANAAANAIMLCQELGVRLKAMPPEAILQNFQIWCGNQMLSVSWLAPW